MENDRSASFVSTVLLCDIRGFTRLLEHLAPNEAFSFVDRFLEDLTSAVANEGGSVNNLTGDGFLAQFGLGLNDNLHALRAVNCAIEMRATLRKINQERHLEKKATVNLGVGLHSGVIAGGKVTLKGYSSFLIIGDTINVASRIEGLTKTFAVDILLSRETGDLVKPYFNLLTMPPRSVKGKSATLETYWLPPHAKPVRPYNQETQP